jgi:hypothetical protein
MNAPTKPQKTMKLVPPPPVNAPPKPEFAATYSLRMRVDDRTLAAAA